MKRLNIFVDETGDFGMNKKSSELYGVSFTFHDHDSDISMELEKFNSKLEILGYNKMIHMADLIMKRGDYKSFDINVRKSLFTSIYQFSRRIDVKYNTIIINKKFIDNSTILKQQLAISINEMIKKNIDFFEKYDSIVMYYDNGQETLGTILDSIFNRFDNFIHNINFDKVKKRLFQVSDMLTFVDKYDYKYKNKIVFTKGEDYFFNKDEIRKILKELSKKRL